MRDGIDRSLVPVILSLETTICTTNQKQPTKSGLSTSCFAMGGTVGDYD